MAEAVEKAARAAEHSARLAYGRLVATLTAQTRDIAAAEDALSEAFARALETWPKKGVPNAPEAWLLTAARRKQIDHARRRITAASAEPDILRQIEDAAMDERDPNMP
ncbi:MAG: sigma factor, partial [Pseudomonadota bacterium]